MVRVAVENRKLVTHKENKYWVGGMGYYHFALNNAGQLSIGSSHPHGWLLLSMNLLLTAPSGRNIVMVY